MWHSIKIFVTVLSLIAPLFSSCQEEKQGANEATDPALSRAEEIRAQILAGAPFHKMAENYSDDPGSGPYGGEMGSVHFGQFVPEYDSVILALEPGEISKPIRTKFGYHLIELIAKDNHQFTSRHILIRP